MLSFIIYYHLLSSFGVLRLQHLKTYLLGVLEQNDKKVAYNTLAGIGVDLNGVLCICVVLRSLGGIGEKGMQGERNLRGIDYS